MAKRRRLKSATEAAPKFVAIVHDRRSADLPINASVMVDDVDDAYGLRDAAALNSRGEWEVPPPPKVTVVRSVRDDPLAAMLEAGQVSRIQFQAGRIWQGYFERAEVGPIKAIDPAKEKVDGGRMSDPLSGRVYIAMDMLKECRDQLGHEGDILVRDVLGLRLTLRQAAERRGLWTERGRRYIGARLRECLDSIAKVAGLVRGEAAA